MWQQPALSVLWLLLADIHSKRCSPIGTTPMIRNPGVSWRTAIAGPYRPTVLFPACFDFNRLSPCFSPPSDMGHTTNDIQLDSLCVARAIWLYNLHLRQRQSRPLLLQVRHRRVYFSTPL
ncbi:hypothetical protein BKA82DRAFT_994617 [Pisolithus tinctorius]|uniref:Secreted protein n=1 Tax=Pisolithus tinctorius Marx 270 TaxID=870435 RepID=A0A0C3JS00_PISTI|nr:hypothetical protein BKA82DRAFT_994617 [Pisolithus tinctorius]KIO11923.1 hypothetical protein M404DRAFT_994617 [Pisolithus tinctorius Marx 270]